MLTYVFDKQVFFGADILHELSMFLSVLLTVSVGCMWNAFFDVALHLGAISKSKAFFCALPVIIVFICLVYNVFSGFLFSFDENNVYSRGDYSFISFCLQYLPWAVLFFRALFYKFQTRTLRRSKLRTTFILIGLVSLIFGAYQILTLGKIAFHCFGITSSVFIMFLRFQDDQITNDILTGLNNRYALDTYIDDKFKSYADGMRGKTQLYLIMMDVNDFKRINDVYGHNEGDIALKTVAKALKKVGGHYSGDLFIARFGGDEFAAVYETNAEYRVRNLCDTIKETLINETDKGKYRLTISTGYALYTGKTMSLVELYENADRKLYEDKTTTKNSLN
jgi:diguanylate cyclase (GGDEF)-like protein